MARKRPGLGKGLDALIPQREEFETPLSGSGISEIPINQISPNPRQPRVRFDTEDLSALAASIQEHGIIQPLIISQDSTPDQYTLIAGERRLLAAREAGLRTVPAIVRETSEKGRLELALIENLQRADLNSIETAEAYYQLTEEFGLSHGEVAKQVGKSRVAVTNTLRLLNLPMEIQEALRESVISEGHARSLLSLRTPQSQSAALGIIIKNRMNVRQTEELVRKLGGEKPIRKPKPEPSPEVKALEERLRTQLGTKVVLKQGRKGGSITIHYYSNEELDSLLGYLLTDG